MILCVFIFEVGHYWLPVAGFETMILLHCEWITRVRDMHHCTRLRIILMLRKERNRNHGKCSAEAELDWVLGI